MKHILSLLLLLTTITVHAAREDYNVAFYDRWSSYPNSLLMKMAKDYLHAKNMPDSALVCLTVISNRYYEHKLSKEDLVYCIRSMNDLGYMYYLYYYDYNKAYSYLQQSYKISIDNNNRHYLPFLYLNMGNLMLTYGNVQGSKNFSLQPIAYYHKAIQTSLIEKNMQLYIITLCDMCNLAFISNNTKSISNDISQFKKLRINRGHL